MSNPKVPSIKKKTLAYLAVIRKTCKKTLFPKIYMAMAMTTLFATTLYWALLGTLIHADNADQLANTYLFENNDTFQAATLPDQHTFLLKWPIFLLIKAFGATAPAFGIITVGVTLLTVGALAYLLYRIERRPLIFGTLCLALASVLLLIPTQPYPGGILPVNMAMVTTRNLEYITFICSLILLVRSSNWRSWSFGGASLLMALLVASDKLFLSISIGGALLALIFYAAMRKWYFVLLAVRWLAMSVVGAVVATVVIWLIGTTHVTNIAENSVAGTYGFIDSGKEFALGLVYAVLGLLTNFGANPATDTRLLADIPRQALASTISFRGLGIIVNGTIVVTGLNAVVRLILKSFQMHHKDQKKKKKSKKPSLDRDTAFKLSIVLIWITLAACGAFIVSSHYYPVDARYMGIALFTLFISLATFARYYRFRRPEFIVLAGVILVISIGFNVVAATINFNQEKAAITNTATRNSLVLEAIAQHPVDVLVGDYWRVLPAKLRSKSPLTVSPMESCTQKRDMLSSRSWQLDLRQHSFAYLLTFDKSLTGYPGCSLEQIIKAYGKPNTSILIAGSLTQPKELLLIYDKGSSNKSQKNPTSAFATVTPITTDRVPNTSCSQPTIMNIVAHQDDDLLFMNPDLLTSIKAGQCVRTVYMTSGDAGVGRYYWLSREQGSMAAYNTMVGLDRQTVWTQRNVKLPGGQFIVIASPQGNPAVSLVFMHLPDGNLQGQGFDSSHHESLARLELGEVDVLHTSDQQSTYSSLQVIDALAALMRIYQPSEIRTQANVASSSYPDHSDHMAVGRYAEQAYQNYIEGLETENPDISFYIGYPIHAMPANISDEDLTEKQHAFFDYGRFDGSVCTSAEQCAHDSAYDAYLKRQYKSE